MDLPSNKVCQDYKRIYNLFKDNLRHRIAWAKRGRRDGLDALSLSTGIDLANSASDYYFAATLYQSHFSLGIRPSARAFQAYMR